MRHITSYTYDLQITIYMCSHDLHKNTHIIQFCIERG